MERRAAETLVQRVRLLGDPVLRAVASAVADPDEPAVRAAADALVATLADFRARHGFGRAIAAPQIGVSLRLLAMDLGAGPFCLFHPEVVRRSPETFTRWDDCMSFPFLLVRVRRHRSVDVRFRDGHGEVQEWRGLEPALAELFQHEIDHLDGVLALDRAEGPDGVIARAEFEARPDYFQRQVDGP